MPTPSWTVSFITPTASNSPAKACAGHEANRTRRLDQPPSPVTQIDRPARLATRATSSHYTRATSSESAPLIVERCQSTKAVQSTQPPDAWWEILGLDPRLR